MMPTIMKGLDAETRNKLANRYFWGDSAIFAKMLHDVFDWPLVGVVGGKLIRHVGVRHSDGAILDSRGFHETDEDFAAVFSISDQPDYEVRDLTPEDIREHHNVTGLAKNRARIAAEHLLPDLLWPERSAARVGTLTFAIARLLEDNGYRLQMSARAGETPRILLVPSNGVECTYAVTPEGVDGAYTIELLESKMAQAAN